MGVGGGLLILALAVSFSIACISVHPRFFEVTWYQDGEYTATGDVYRVENFTCAVRDRTELRHWIRFEYQGKVIYCWANDLMPEDARAEYDLTPAAFARIAPLKAGRIKGVEVRVVE